MTCVVLSAGAVYLFFLFRIISTGRGARTVPLRARTVFVFGKRCVGGTPDRDLLRRLERTHGLLTAAPDLHVVLLGGRTADGPAEAEVAFAVLQQLGLPPAARVDLELASCDTLENLRFARAHFAPSDTQSVALISNRYHLARCCLLARALGFETELVAAEQQFRLRDFPLRVWLAEAWLTMVLSLGASWARLIGHRMQDRLR